VSRLSALQQTHDKARGRSLLSCDFIRGHWVPHGGKESHVHYSLFRRQGQKVTLHLVRAIQYKGITA
jgi:hypothetical protein